MLVQIRKTKRAFAAGLVAAFGFILISCASHKNMALVDDPNGQESTIPWNKREKWEDTGPMSGLSDRR
jgi:hypothetical protein